MRKDSDRIVSCDFFNREALEIAPELLGCYLVRRFDDNTEFRERIVELEVYYGEDDKGCHASKGRTPRTEIMYHEGGNVYVYLIYGMYWMLNIVTGKSDSPQAILIRGTEFCNGPGRLGRKLQLDNTFYGEDLLNSNRIWIEYGDSRPEYQKTKRIGIDYAGEPWVSKLWRYVAIL